MPFKYNSLLYELNKECWINLKLDVREIFSQEKFGRHYEIFDEKEKVIIKYSKRNEQTNEEEYTCFLVISGIDEKLKYEKILRWEEEFYPYDKLRNSPPFNLFIFNALKIKCKKLLFSFSGNKEKAIEESNFLMKNLEKIKKKQKGEIRRNLRLKKHRLRKKISKDIEFAYNSCVNSLNQLKAIDEEKLTPGLPWFIQQWTRDELVSSLKIFDITKRKKFLLKYLKNISEDGRLPNILGNNETNADSIGWLFKRIYQSLKIFNKKEKELIKRKLILSIEKIKKNYVREGFIYNNPKETWMDSLCREGARIEIQAFFLNMLSLAYELTKEEKYRKFEVEFRNNLRENFWNGKILADGLNDFTIRPNVFLAYYIYPKLLSKKEWEICFENSLKKLWLRWGGLSTIDKNANLFTPEDTGENPKSYHNGNSWFFLNNLTALCLWKVNKKKFKKKIEKILNSSTKDILWYGAIGHHSEVSSAKNQKARGCIAQAWSAALYLELVEEIS